SFREFCSNGWMTCRFDLTGFGDERQGRIAVLERLTGETIANFHEKDNPPSCADFSADGKLLATGMDDGSILIWDLRRLDSCAAAATSEVLIANLGGKADAAYQAMLKLALTPEVTLALLEKRLQPERTLTKGALEKLVESLDSDDFETRE